MLVQLTLCVNVIALRFQAPQVVLLVAALDFQLLDFRLSSGTWSCASFVAQALYHE